MANVIQINSMHTGLNSSLLIRHPETKELYVNFDPDILTLARETDVMVKLKLEIPAAAINLKLKQNALKEFHNKLMVNGKC